MIRPKLRVLCLELILLLLAVLAFLPIISFQSNGIDHPFTLYSGRFNGNALCLPFLAGPRCGFCPCCTSAMTRMNVCDDSVEDLMVSSCTGSLTLDVLVPVGTESFCTHFPLTQQLQVLRLVPTFTASPTVPHSAPRSGAFLPPTDGISDGATQNVFDCVPSTVSLLEQVLCVDMHFMPTGKLSIGGLATLLSTDRLLLYLLPSMYGLIHYPLSTCSLKPYPPSKHGLSLLPPPKSGLMLYLPSSNGLILYPLSTNRLEVHTPWLDILSSLWKVAGVISSDGNYYDIEDILLHYGNFWPPAFPLVVCTSMVPPCHIPNST